MRLPTEPPGSPSYYMLRQIHQGRRYRVLAIVTTVTLLLVCGWTLLGGDVDPVPRSGLGYYYGSLFPAAKTSSATLEPFSHSLIPAKIWQIFLPKMTRHVNHWHEFKYINPEALQVTPSWLALNPDYRFTLVGGDGATAFVEEHFSHQPRIVEAFNNLTNVGMKSDFLRYLILGIEGGVYTDTDTLALKPVARWIPIDLRSQVRLIVGLEFDRLDGPNWADIPHDLQFCQWTIAAAPNHPVFAKMADRVLASLEYLSEVKGGGAPLQDLEIGSFDVMNTTGPAAWTDIVFEQLQEYDPSLNETGDLSGMTEPRLFGDVLVLPIDAFGMGQLHSNSTNDGTIPRAALVKHLFTGSWREPDPENEENQEQGG